ncbi:GMC family oxidoreductase N-terminal domain-containing protein [Mesorhizobium sp. BR1-1-7]|uniref:GMC family oxidoreductase n=1 Tax=Mesorhizobium sp. BR1-1-7 TaxID=2876647 RepID=UPI001CC9D7C5|nr:GMC family oxidoreductase N-terminal domain-containing protein [Mesorhizobium sp. BR1-1-7]MBZ9921690.1 GMC family oxidoreductase N-terminal domain-containing protein [Mesorhizobium sp. BR1-1-7]
MSPRSHPAAPGETCDYLIIGGGSAGCTLASRLSEDPNVSVVLVEAGKNVTRETASDDVLSNYPGKAYFNPDYTWPGLKARLGGGRRNDPEAGRIARYEQSRLLGGGSTINGLCANRGAPSDYDEWERLGAGGWDWESVLPYFRKLERDLNFHDDLHGADGPVAISRFPTDDWTGFVRAVTGELGRQGYGLVDDQNGAWRDGYMPVATSIDENGQRVSCAYAYLTPSVRARSNLSVLTETMVERIMFDGKEATGAVLRDGQGRHHTVAARETVLSCGTIHSPAMLLRSGIGPASEVAALGLKGIADRRGVGRNLIEHPVISVSCLLDRSARMHKPFRHHTQAHLRYSSGLEDCPDGDMSLAIIARSGWHAMGYRIGTLYVWVNKSYSQGSVRLASGSVEAEPIVDFRMLSDDRDMQRLREAFRFVAALAQSETVSGISSIAFPANYSDRVRHFSVPGMRNQAVMQIFASMLDALPAMRPWLVRKFVTEGATLAEILSDDTVLDNYLTECVTGVWHPVGTCRMGRQDDPLAVTDNSGRVYGVGRLRVCDASVMPSIPRANTNIPTIMVAERMADLIKKERASNTVPSEASAA